jgi:ComF family protein
MELARSALNKIVDFALPPRCPACGEHSEDSLSFCVQCWSGLKFLDGQGCVHCGIPVLSLDLACAECLMKVPPHDGVRSAIVYDDIARQVITRCKYGRRIGLARAMGRGLLRHAAEFDGALLAPVPLHKWRLWSRGFNQSLLIANYIGKRTGQSVICDLVLRIKATPPLSGMPAGQRKKAIKGAFAINPKRQGYVDGRTILLVDDVYTTGATANGCAQELKKAGAEKVIILSWARALKAGTDFSS